MQSWLIYWRPDTGRCGSLYHAVSDQFWKVALGDEGWFVIIKDGEFILFGHMLVGEMISQREAEKRFGKDVWPGKYHAIPRGNPESHVDIRITNIALDLRFEGGVAQFPPGYSGRNLQIIRKLCPESASLLRRIWERKSAARSAQADSRAGK